ncbi:MAG: SIS domain-containing protein [Eubacteriales bacterium]|nr:SIS domain-containing protein [Eubacteriales bacterium]
MVYMWEEISEQPAAIERCRKENSKTIKNLVKDLDSKKLTSVYIAARGTSMHAATYGKYILALTKGIPVSLATPSVFTIYESDLKFENCLVMAVSQSGKAADALEVIRSANKQGAVTVSITNDPESPLAKEACYHLYCAAGPELSVAATKTFTTEMYLFGMLAAEWSGNEAFEEELKKVPKGMKEVLKLEDEITKKVERYRFMKECFILARGVNYPIALEATLKIQETNYVRAKGFASSEFQHGPFAMIEQDMPVFVYAPDGPSKNDMHDMINRLKQNGAEVIVISNVDELLAKGDTALKIPYTDNDMISPYYNALVAQMFACKLALAKGMNPDKPRSLSKVTITR